MRTRKAAPIWRLIVTVSLLLSLIACGGVEPTPPAAEPVTITGSSTASTAALDTQPTSTATQGSPAADAQDWRLVPTSFEKADLGDGWSEIRAELAIENHSDIWAVIKLLTLSGKITTAEGYEYELGLGSIDGNTLEGFFVPPGFRIRGERNQSRPLALSARVATDTTRYQLTLPYSLTTWEGGTGWQAQYNTIRNLQFELLLEQVSSGLSFPFIDADGWDAYRMEYADRVHALRPGLVLGTDFGTISFENLRLEPEADPIPDWPVFKVDVTVSNDSGGYGLTPNVGGYLYSSEGYVTGMFQQRSESSDSSSNWAEIGPKQTASHILMSWAQPREMDTMPTVACLVFENLQYRITGEKVDSLFLEPVVVCFP